MNLTKCWRDSTYLLVGLGESSFFSIFAQPQHYVIFQFNIQIAFIHILIKLKVDNVSQGIDFQYHKKVAIFRAEEIYEEI